MTKRKLFNDTGCFKALMDYDNYTQENLSNKPCEPRTLGGRDVVNSSPSLSTHSNPDLNNQVQKFYAKFPNWEEQARRMSG